jgi:hypothetical protein
VQRSVRNGKAADGKFRYVPRSSSDGAPHFPNSEGRLPSVRASIASSSGCWTIRRPWWVPTYYFTVPGFETAVFESGPASDALPPDTPPRTARAGLGRDFPPFHYTHPFIGARTPIPTSGKQA